MSIRRSIVQQVVFSAVAGLIVLGGCAKKQETVLKEPVPEKEEIPYVAPQPVIDTTDEVTFDQAELDAEFQRKVTRNLQTVYFGYDRHVLTSESVEKLAVAAAFLMEHTTLRVLCEGHCDERGSSEYNMGLGENRARAVKEYLANYGVPPIRIEITSWGKERPVNYHCADDVCHSQNRRVDFKVLSK